MRVYIIGGSHDGRMFETGAHETFLRLPPASEPQVPVGNGNNINTVEIETYRIIEYTGIAVALPENQKQYTTHQLLEMLLKHYIATR